MGFRENRMTLGVSHITLDRRVDNLSGGEMTRVRIAELNANGLKFYGGDYEFYREQREVERDAAEQTLQSARQR